MSAANDTDRRPTPRPTRGGWGWGGASLVAIVLGAIVLAQTRLDPATPPPAPAATAHVEQHGGEIAGIPLHPDAGIATLAARLTPATGVTTIRSVGAAATPATPAKPAAPPNAIPAP